MKKDSGKLTELSKRIDKLEEQIKNTPRSENQKEHDKLVKQLGNEYRKFKKENIIKKIDLYDKVNL